MLDGVGHTTAVILAASVPNGVITIKMIPQERENVNFFSGLIGVWKRLSTRAVFFTVARGPVPRDHHHHDMCKFNANLQLIFLDILSENMLQ